MRGLRVMRRRGLEPPPGYPGPGPQPGNSGVISVRIAPDRPNVPGCGRYGRIGRSGCCHASRHRWCAWRRGEPYGRSGAGATGAVTGGDRRVAGLLAALSAWLLPLHGCRSGAGPIGRQRTPARRPTRASSQRRRRRPHLELSASAQYPARSTRARRSSVARMRNMAVVEAAVLERGPRRAGRRCLIGVRAAAPGGRRAGLPSGQRDRGGGAGRLGAGAYGGRSGQERGADRGLQQPHDRDAERHQRREHDPEHG